MCLIVFAVDAHPELWLALAANRDEMFSRPTAPASLWREDNGAEWFGGRDLEKGGTWLGLSKAGRLAAVTNVRAPGARRDGASRGWLARDAVTSREPIDAYARAIDRARYPAFNLLSADGQRVIYARDDQPEAVSVARGLHGLSNDRLDTYWPKVEIALRRLSVVLEQPASPAPDAFFELLADRTVAEDAMLPKTGVPLELERALSAAFVSTPIYGTRCSTVILWRRDGTIAFEERGFDAAGARIATVAETFESGARRAEPSPT